MYQRLGVPDDALEAAGARWLELYRATEQAAAPADGVAESLRRLSDAGFVMGLVTAGHRDVVEGQLERYGLGDAAAESASSASDPIAGEAAPGSAPARPRRSSAASHRIATARYVGDVPDDMRMARAVGSLGVGIESTVWTPRRPDRRGREPPVYPVAAFVDELLGSRASDGPGRRPAFARSSSRTATRPRRCWTPRGPAGPPASSWSSRRTAAPATPTALGAPRRPLGRRRRFDRAGGARGPRGGGRRRSSAPRRTRTSPTPSWRVLPAVEAGADAVTDPRRRSAACASTMRCRTSASWPPGARRPRRMAVRRARRRGSRCSWRRTAAGAPLPASCVGRPGDLVSLLPDGRPARGRDHERARGTRSPASRWCSGGPRGVSNVRTGPVARISARIGPASRDRDPCYISGHERPRGRPAWRPTWSFPTRPARSTGSPTSAAAGPSCTSIPKDDTPGCNTEACQFRDLDERLRRDGRRRLGREQGQRREPPPVPREVRPAVHAPVRPRSRGHRALRRMGREDRRSAGRTWASSGPRS